MTLSTPWRAGVKKQYRKVGINMKFSKFLKVIDDDCFYFLVLFPLVIFLLFLATCCNFIDMNSFFLLNDLNNLFVSGVECIVSWVTLVFLVLYVHAETNNMINLRRLKTIEECCSCLCKEQDSINFDIKRIFSEIYSYIGGRKNAD